MEIPNDLKSFFEMMAEEEGRTVDEVKLDALRHYKRIIQGQAERELMAIETGAEVDLIGEFFREEGMK